MGDRASISPAIEESMRVSGLTHVLSISGLHMAMVAGTLFALVRGLLATVPALALGFPIKTTAALVALAGSAGYLILSGNDWPAQRSFYMLAIVLVGVMVGRAALNLRTVAVAATLVLALGPQAILEAGTQMSFAATLALVAVFQGVKGLWSRAPKGTVAWQILARGGMFVAALSLTSLWPAPPPPPMRRCISSVWAPTDCSPISPPCRRWNSSSCLSLSPGCC